MQRILCIRLDNMGDLIMSSPAIEALKTTFQSHITVLTSTMGAVVAPSIPAIDDTIIFDAPWVKSQLPDPASSFNEIVQQLREGRYDAAVVFTVYSQNPLPAVMLAYLAGIPMRLAYCRENPYHLLTHWAPEREPYTHIHHQVQRDLNLVAHIGAKTDNEKLQLEVKDEQWPEIMRKIEHCGIDTSRPWAVMHTGVSDFKRQYPVQKWIEAGKAIIAKTKLQLLLTGTSEERAQNLRIRHGIGVDAGACVAAGLFSLTEFIVLIKHASLVISVNTSTVHIAAATNTPVVVLYALTNPQHTPWKVPCSVLYFDVPQHLQSKNEVIRYVYEQYDKQHLPPATTENIVTAVSGLLEERLEKNRPA
ncbi:glycosyltransferase family 9 protein [Chitinophaga agrisoli]|uniref:Glycosyltransferase family 9 protein n=1 Tax=Chitinophaga agrisoli TaxID=2607653 RepID=A0A5B2VXG6_9BACT|nr:glycosyltransferase family 9 protein [Chitinophaga agrisoli]KAA2242896.1 glycosyltransferase family 9 protein [Chitinophaga agrisoli]